MLSRTSQTQISILRDSISMKSKTRQATKTVASQDCGYLWEEQLLEGGFKGWSCCFELGARYTHGLSMWKLTNSTLRHMHVLNVYCCYCSVVSDSFAVPLTVACQAPLSTGFPRQEYWSGLPFPPPGDISDPGIEHTSPALADRFFTTEPQGSLNVYYTSIKK